MKKITVTNIVSPIFKTTLCLFATVVLLVSCRPNASVEDNKAHSKSLEGAWELREVRGGMIAGVSPYYAPGNGHMWQFKDSTFKKLSAGTLVNSGVFTRDRDTCPATQTVLDAFILENSYGHRLFYEISNDTLTIYNGVIAADGTIEKYVRVAGE